MLVMNAFVRSLSAIQCMLALPYLTLRGTRFTPWRKACSGPNAHPRINRLVNETSRTF